MGVCQPGEPDRFWKREGNEPGELSPTAVISKSFLASTIVADSQGLGYRPGSRIPTVETHVVRVVEQNPPKIC